jgi:hypothetical protein
VVHPSDQPFVADPPGIALKLGAGIDSTFTILQILTPNALRDVRVEYLPPDGSGNLDAGDQLWLWMDSQDLYAPDQWYRTRVGAIRCNVFVESETYCLAPGRYEALVHISSPQPDGSGADIGVPISLTVNP